MKPPNGMRFLINLVTDQSLQEARAELRAIFGERALAAAAFVKGCRNLTRTSSPQWVESNSGWRVYVPEEFKL